jgi:hypothetical protein
MNNMSIKLKEILAKELERRNLSINHVARDCEIPVSVLHGWVHGTLPSAKNLHHIKTLSKYLGMRMDDMLFEEEQRSSLILFTSTFMDGDTQYKLTVEKIKGN